MKTSGGSIPTLPHHEKNASIISLITETHCQPIRPLSNLTRSLRHISLTQALLTLFCLALSYAANSRYVTTLSYNEDTLTDALRISAIVLSLAQVVLIGKYYRLYFALGLEIGRWEQCTEMGDSGLVGYIVAEALVHCVVLPPRVNWEAEISMLGRNSVLAMSDVVFVLKFARVYHILRANYWQSICNTSRGFFYSKLADIAQHNRWVLRAITKRHAIFTLILTWLSLCLIAGICLKTLDFSVPGNKLDNVWTAYWAVVVSEATIGYGDIVPLTHVSRVIVILTVVTGLAVYSSTVILVRQKLDLTHAQVQLYSAVAFLDQTKSLRLPASCLIQRWWRYRIQRFHGQPFFRLRFRLQIQLKVYRVYRNKVNSLQDLLFYDSVRKFGKSMKDQIETSAKDFAPIRKIQRQCQEINKNEYSIRLKMKAVVLGAKACLHTFHEDFPATGSSEDLPYSQHSRSRQSTLHKATVLYRARDSAFRRVKRLRSLLHVPHRDSVSSQHSHDS